MNSLQELNGFNNSFTIDYVDNRITDVTFDRATASNQSLIVNEGSSFENPVGIDILEIVNPAQANVILTLTFTGPVGIDLTWDTGTSAQTSYQGNGVWRATNILTKQDWDIIKQPLVRLPTNLPNAYTGTFSYTVNVQYTNGNLGTLNKSYTVTVSVLDVVLLTNPLTATYPPSAVTQITNTPQISNVDAEYPGVIWTVTGTPSSITSIVNFNSTYTAYGTFSFNNSTKVFTISGNREAVNNHLGSLWINSNAVETDFTVTYTAVNAALTISDTKTQTLRNGSTQFLSNASNINSFYNEDSINVITGAPEVTDLDYTGNSLYTVVITPSNLDAVDDISSTGIVRPSPELTVHGTASISSAQKYVGNSSMSFSNPVPSSGSAVSFPLLQTTLFGNFAGYTIEGWVYHTAWQNSESSAAGEGSSSVWSHSKPDGWVASSFGFNKAGKITFTYTTTGPYGANVIQESTASGVLNTWQHIAMVKNGSTITLYVNGVAKTSGSITENITYHEDNGLLNRIGSHVYGGTFFLDEFRMSKIARYTSNFVLSTQFFNDYNTVLLMHGEDTFYDDTNIALPDGIDLGISTSVFDDDLKTLTIEGIKSQVNAHLTNLAFKAGQDFSQQFQLTYSVLTPNDDESSKIQNFIAGSNDNEVSNLSIGRNYVSNNENLIFATDTPQITDLDYSEGNSYAVTLSCDSGEFAYATSISPLILTSLSSPITITGTRTEINQALPTVRFYPNFDISAEIDLTVTVTKNSSTVSIQTVPMTGTAGTYTGARNINYLTSQTDFITYEDVKYGKYELLLVGGGGAGGNYNGGGGGAGEVITSVNSLFDSSVTYNLVIGAGGLHNTLSPGNGNKGGDGGDSVFGDIVALGGGGGYHGANGNPLNGQGGSYAGQQGSSAFYNSTVGSWYGGGGKGAGGNSNSPTGGAASYLSSWNQVYSGGGAGGGNGSVQYDGGAANSQVVGGQGADYNSPATSGTENRGAGGGGGSNSSGYQFGADGRYGIFRIKITAR